MFHTTFSSIMCPHQQTRLVERGQATTRRETGEEARAGGYELLLIDTGVDESNLQGEREKERKKKKRLMKKAFACQANNSTAKKKKTNKEGKCCSVIEIHLMRKQCFDGRPFSFHHSSWSQLNESKLC